MNFEMAQAHLLYWVKIYLSGKLACSTSMNFLCSLHSLDNSRE